MLYEGNCGRSGASQIIHTERMSRFKNQILRGEENMVPASEIGEAETEQAPDDAEAHKTGDKGEASYTSNGRKIRKPEWLKDYAFSIFRCDQMVNTKTHT